MGEYLDTVIGGRGGTRAYRHRIVAAEIIGRPLTPNEHVHHRNGDKRDNRPENLEILSPTEHRHRHRLSECSRGHALTPENVYVRPDNGKRMCRACRTLRASARAAQRKAARHARFTEQDA